MHLTPLLYESLPFADTHPLLLEALGKLYGLNPAAADTSRVLELGCGTGGNLIPLAYYLPDAEFLGYDLSAAQIAKGEDLIKMSGLLNIELRPGDILQLGEELGQFDYIIAHGVYSWVPEAVREHLLHLYQILLKPDGIGYISMNAQPGWSRRGVLRHILRHATRHCNDEAGKLELAYRTLARLEQGYRSRDDAFSRYLHKEILYLHDAHPSYLAYEYLTEINQAWYLGEFTEHLGAHGLRYLGDTSLDSAEAGVFGAEIEQCLADIVDSDDREEWLDIYRLRPFRQALVVHDHVTPRDLTLETFVQLGLGCELDSQDDWGTQTGATAAFRSPQGTQYNVQHPLTRAVIQCLRERFPDTPSLQQIMPEARSMLDARGVVTDPLKQDEPVEELFSLLVQNAFLLRPTACAFPESNTECPAATPLARAQAILGWNQLGTRHQSALSLDEFSRALILQMNGQASRDELVRVMCEQFGSPSMPPEQISLAVGRLINTFAKHGVLL